MHGGREVVRRADTRARLVSARDEAARATRLVKPPVANGDHPRDVVASANNEQLAGSRRGLLAASAFLSASSLLPVDAARALAVPDDDQRYMVGVFDVRGLVRHRRARAIKLVKRFGIVRTLVGGNDAMWSDNKAHAVHVFPVSKYDEIHKWHATENEWWPDIELSAERAAQLQTEKFNGLDDTATQGTARRLLLHAERDRGRDRRRTWRGRPVEDTKVGSGVAYGAPTSWRWGRRFGASSEAANGKVKILASVGGASVGGAGDRAAALHWFKSEFKAKAYIFRRTAYGRRRRRGRRVRALPR